MITADPRELCAMVRLHPDTRVRLQIAKQAGESYDAVINRIMDAYDNRKEQAR